MDKAYIMITYASSVTIGTALTKSTDDIPIVYVTIGNDPDPTKNTACNLSSTTTRNGKKWRCNFSGTNVAVIYQSSTTLGFYEFVTWPVSEVVTQAILS